MKDTTKGNLNITRRKAIGLGAGALVGALAAGTLSRRVTRKHVAGDATLRLVEPETPHVGITTHLASALVGQTDPTEVMRDPTAGAEVLCCNIPIHVKYTFMDEAVVGTDISLDTIFDRDSDAWIIGMLPQYEMFITGYTSPECPGEYLYVLDPTKFNDTSWTIHDIDVARDHDGAEMVDGCTFDYEAGILHVPRELIDGRPELQSTMNCPLQVQLLCSFDARNGAPVSKTYVNIHGDDAGVSLCKSGYIETSTYDSCIAFQLVEPEDAHLVSLDDIQVTYESCFTSEFIREGYDIDYDPTTGILYVGAPAFVTPGIDVVVRTGAMTEVLATMGIRRADAALKSFGKLRFYGDYYSDEDDDDDGTSTHSSKKAAEKTYSYVEDNDLLEDLYEGSDEISPVWAYQGGHIRVPLKEDGKDPVHGAGSGSAFTTTPGPSDDNYGKSWKIDWVKICKYRKKYFDALLWYAYVNRDFTGHEDFSFVECTPEELLDSGFGQFRNRGWGGTKVNKYDEALRASNNDYGLWEHGIILPGSKMTGKYFVSAKLKADTDDDADVVAGSKYRYKSATGKDNLDKKFWRTIKGMDGTNDVMFMVSSCAEIRVEVKPQNWEGTNNGLKRTFARIMEIEREGKHPYIAILFFTADRADTGTGQIAQVMVKFHLELMKGYLRVNKKFSL